MTDTRRCPQCDTEIPATSPAGLCPKCLLAAGFASQPGSGPTEALPGAASSGISSGGFVPPTPEALAGRFPQLEILALLGKGGMGAVYKARQRGLDRLVALKILPPEVGADAAFAERFTREARALAQLSHSNIVGVYDFGQADGLYYFIMEYVDGVNLRQAILAGEMQPKEALAIVPQICDALQFAHDEGIVHRDIKPENILIDKRGRVKIADFGLARLLGREHADHRLTATHQVMGTLRYMAPEQLEGSHDVDHRADIYSLGVVFYELLTGELPIGRFAPPSKKVQIDVRLDEVVLRALEKEPEQRYQHASDLRTSVDQIVGAGDRARRSLPLERKTDLSPTAPDARLSKCALVGAIWAPFAFAALLLAIASVPIYAVQRSTSSEEQLGIGILGYAAMFIAAVVGLIGFAAPFGTTILGVVAIGQIRRSAGKLYGLPLAVFDALVFPLLLLDLLLFALAGVSIWVLEPLPAGPEPPKAWLLLPLLFVLLLIALFIAWLDWRIVRAVWRHIMGYVPPPKPVRAVNVSIAASEMAPAGDGTKPRLPFAYIAKTMLLAAADWLLVPLLWNAPQAGLASAALAIGGLSVYIARRTERFLPATALRWQKRTPIQRWAHLVFGVLFSAGGVYFLFFGGYQAWERLNWNFQARSQDEFRQEYQGAEHRVLQRLQAFKNDVPRAELAPQKYESTAGWGLSLTLRPSIGMFMGFGICASLFVGALMIFGTYHVLLSDRYDQGTGWGVYSWPACTLTVATLLPMIAYAFVGFLILPVVNGTLGVGYGKLISTPQDIQAVNARIESWSVANGFVGGDLYSWQINKVPLGGPLATVEQRHLWRPNVFDRWQMTWAGLQRIAPDISLEIVGDASGKETAVMLYSRTRVGDGPEAKAVKTQLESLYEAIKNIDPLHEEGKK